MKSKFLVLNLLLLFSFLPIQNTKTDLLCDKKWVIKSMKSGDFKMPVPAEKEMWMKFYEDGKHVAHDNTGTENGTWKFTKNQDSIIFVDPKQTKRVMSLDSLSTNRLQIAFVDRGRKINIFMEKE